MTLHCIWAKGQHTVTASVKKKLSDTKWQYTATFQKPITCHISVKPKNGYNILYQNVGVYAGITDRGCDGGTITFMKNPQTGDRAPHCCCGSV